jgi:hypothetical protein
MVVPRNHPKVVHFGIETWAPSISRNPISVSLLFEEFDGHNFRARLQFLVKAIQALRPTPAGLADAIGFENRGNLEWQTGKIEPN